MYATIKELASGFLIGIANIIPGVSGGTFLLILGMYQRVMSAISGVNFQTVKSILTHCTGILFSRDRKKHFVLFIEYISEKDLFFLFKVGIGVIVAIVVLSDLMLFLLKNQFANTYAFFFGLILVSTGISLKLVKKMTIGRVVMLLLGICVTVGVTMAVNPADKVKAKSDHYKIMYDKERLAGVPTDTAMVTKKKAFTFTGVYTPSEYIVGAFAGALSISAMVLPGISGSLVLILVGQYYKVINAVSSLRTLQLDYLLFLLICAAGMGIGVLFFARLVTFVFNRFYHGTIAFLTGLMAGSLYTLWPFKNSIVMDQFVKGPDGINMIKDVVVRTNINILPSNVSEAVFAFLLCAVGAGIMVVMGRYTEK